MLTQELIQYLFNYDPTTGYLIRKNTQGGKISGTRTGHVDCNGYRRVRIKGKLYAEHVVIWLFINGYLPDLQIDHINRVKSDNRIANLRLVNNSQNQQNIPIKKNNSTGVTGVSFHKKANKYTAAIMVNRKTIFLGLFNTIEDATVARKNGEEIYFSHASV